MNNSSSNRQTDRWSISGILSEMENVSTHTLECRSAPSMQCLNQRWAGWRFSSRSSISPVLVHIVC
jgi:hypothetical protein